ncbi:MAG: type II toxin-antitoxin system PemK/MazF family toxin [Verrucomicrobiales bacterium]|nr:type II toxin-antitoxin system PemK/MazF family toxin [Verrucomicrobiales bacterium]
MTAKVRPCVVVSIREPDRRRNLVVVVPLTTEIRGGECEIAFPKPRWLRQESVVNVLGIAGVDCARILRRIAPFPKESFVRVMDATARMLGLACLQEGR